MDQVKKKISEIKIFSIPFVIGEIQENISITTNIPLKSSQDQLINQAINLHLQGNISKAAIYYQQLINQECNDHRVFSNYGIILRANGNLQNAEIFTRKAIELNHNFADAHSNLGSILRDLGQLEEAELFIRKAIELKPDYAMAHSNLGTILNDFGNFADAEVSLRKAIELNPNCAEFYSNLGILLRNLGNLQEAEISQRKAIELNPNFADAYSNLAYLQLLQGDYQSGLKNYEFRFKKKTPLPLHGSPSIRKVDDIDIAKGEKLLVVSEQGLGDTLQYMRYIPYLRSQGFDVSFCALTKLHTLIKASGIDKNPLKPEQANQLSEGKWIPLLSLPRYLAINPTNPIVSQPYIHSTDELREKWKNIISKEKKAIIGLNWQGNKKIEKTYQGRSIPLEQFSILADNNEITMLSLQKGFGSEQFNHCSFKNKFVECQPQIDATWDFLENAAIIENCDLIITCDTSIAHLAGGMGKKVWLLLKDIPFWTWGLKEKHTFWYPSMRLFRQKERNDWKEVMISVSNVLKEWR